MNYTDNGRYTEDDGSVKVRVRDPAVNRLHVCDSTEATEALDVAKAIAEAQAFDAQAAP